MLSDIGMSGRYSLAKAKSVREKLAFEADIADVQVEAKRFTKGLTEKVVGDQLPILQPSNDNLYNFLGDQSSDND